MRAKVTAEDRKVTKEQTGDSSFPMRTGVEIDHAITLRGHGNSKSRGQVLRLAASAARRLRREGKISSETCNRLMNRIETARKADAARSQD